MTVVAHAEDLATMIASAVGNAAASGQVFNAVADRGISLDGMAKLCAKVAGAEAKIVHYDPKGVAGVDVKKAFPFRPVHFYAEPRAAKALLGWAPKWSLEAALAERWAFYEASGRGKKDKAFPDDDAILAAVGAK
jgi:nucleoside-diphosphate-sugar epimerase